MEQLAIPQRIEELTSEVQYLQEKEDRLQKHYYSLIVPTDSVPTMEMDESG